MCFSDLRDSEEQNLDVSVLRLGLLDQHSWTSWDGKPVLSVLASNMLLLTKFILDFNSWFHSITAALLPGL